MKKLLFLALVNMVFACAVNAKDCVDCSFGIEGFPTLSSLQQASCTDCGCYTKAHNDMIEDLLPERAALVRDRLKESATFAVENSTKDLARLDRLLKKIPNIRSAQVNSALSSCNLQRIKSNVANCPSAKNSKHMQELFGSENIDGVLSSLAAKFSQLEGGSSSSNSSCLSDAQIDQIKSNQKIASVGKSLVIELKNNQALVKGKSLSSVISGSELSNLIASLGDSLNYSEISSILRNEEAFKYIVENVDSFFNADGTLADAKILDFFSAEAYEKFPSISSEIVAEMNDTCISLVESVSAMACAGDSVAFTTDAEIVRKSFSYSPEDHAAGFDSLFVDDTGKDVIDTSYVSHIYYCAAKTCEGKSELSVCNKAKVDGKLKDAFAFVSAESVKNQIQNALAAQFDSSVLCKLADCKGSETQMNACYESIKQELGDDGEEILLAYSRVPNSSIAATESSPGSNYTPYVYERSQFAQNFLGEYAKTSSDSTSTTSATQASSDEQGNRSAPRDSSDTVVTNQRSAAPRSVANNTGSGEKVVTASEAFREFMNQRLNSFSSSSASSSRTQARSTSNQTGTGITPNDRRALDSLNQASETIEDLRDSYRKSAFERMERLVEKSKEINRSNGSFTGFNSGGSNTSTPFTSSGSRSTDSRVNAAPISAADRIANIDSNTVGANNVDGVAQAGSAGQGSASGRGPASIGASSQAPRVTFSSAGQPTLNVALNELPTMNPIKVENEGVDITKPFKLAVKVDDQVYTVEVRSSLVRGKRILEPLLDGLSVSLKAEILRSPLFKEYRSLMAIN